MIVWPRVTPRRRALAGSARGYSASWVGALCLLAVLHVAIVASALSLAEGTSESAPSTGIPMVRVVSVGVGVLFVVMGNYLPKTRANWTIGFRLP